MGGPVKMDDTKTEGERETRFYIADILMEFCNLLIFFSLLFRRCCRRRRHRRLVNFQSMSTVCERARHTFPWWKKSEPTTSTRLLSKMSDTQLLLLHIKMNELACEQTSDRYSESESERQRAAEWLLL